MKFSGKTANINVITTCKAHSIVTHIKQQNIFITSRAVDIIITAYYIHFFTFIIISSTSSSYIALSWTVGWRKYVCVFEVSCTPAASEKSRKLSTFLVIIFCILAISSFHIVNSLITSDKGGGTCFCPCLSVCLLARLLKNACMDLDEMLRVDRCLDMDKLINFWVRSGL